MRISDWSSDVCSSDLPETAQAQPAAAAEPAPKQDAGPAAPPKKRSNVGMAVAAGFAICIVASVTSAVQASRAASAANGSAASSPDALAARLNKIEKLLEQQRNALDALSATPASPVSSAGSAAASQNNTPPPPPRAKPELNIRRSGIARRKCCEWQRSLFARCAGRTAQQDREAA